MFEDAVGRVFCGRNGFVILVVSSSSTSFKEATFSFVLTSVEPSESSKDLLYLLPFSLSFKCASSLKKVF